MATKQPRSVLVDEALSEIESIEVQLEKIPRILAQRSDRFVEELRESLGSMRRELVGIVLGAEQSNEQEAKNAR